MAYREYDKTDAERLLDRLDRIADALEALTAQVDAPEPVQPAATPIRKVEGVDVEMSAFPETWSLDFARRMFALHVVAGCQCSGCIWWFNKFNGMVHDHVLRAEVKR